MPSFLRLVLFGLGAVLLQWLIFGRLPLWGAVPDVALLFVALQGLRYGRVVGTVTGFGTGLLLDAIYGTWGLQMLLKTLMGFIVGSFQSEQGEYLRVYPGQAFLGALVVALVHHGLMVIVLALDQGTRTLFLITGVWLGSALYTAGVAFIASLFRSRGGFG